MSKLLSLDHQMPFYGAYHANSTNINIHMIFVPIILYTVFVWLSNTGPLLTHWPTASELPFQLPRFLSIPEPNAATLLALAAVPGYIIMQPFAGLTVAPIIGAMVLSAKYFTDTYGKQANVVATVAHIASWIMQFVGHGVYEGRAPALLQNIFQVYLAPFFVWLEFLFSLGFLPDTHKRLSKLIDVKRAELQASDAKKKLK